MNSVHRQIHAHEELFSSLDEFQEFRKANNRYVSFMKGSSGLIITISKINKYLFIYLFLRSPAYDLPQKPFCRGFVNELFCQRRLILLINRRLFCWMDGTFCSFQYKILSNGLLSMCCGCLDISDDALLDDTETAELSDWEHVVWIDDQEPMVEKQRDNKDELSEQTCHRRMAPEGDTYGMYPGSKDKERRVKPTGNCNYIVLLSQHSQAFGICRPI